MTDLMCDRYQQSPRFKRLVAESAKPDGTR
jgi:hypothetical protein